MPNHRIEGIPRFDSASGAVETRARGRGAMIPRDGDGRIPARIECWVGLGLLDFARERAAARGSPPNSSSARHRAIPATTIQPRDAFLIEGEDLPSRSWG